MKPPECEGCPLLEAPGPVFGTGPLNATICEVGEAPANYEIALGEPFSGGAGRVLNALNAKAKLWRSDIRIENSVCCQVPHNSMSDWMDENPAAACHAIEHCSQSFLIPRLEAMSDLKVVIGLGDSANYALTERRGIYTYRGYPYQHPLRKYLIVPTLHPAYLMRDQSMWNVVVADIARAKRYAEVGWVRPPERFVIASCVSEVEQFASMVVSYLGNDYLGIDIENPRNILVCIGFGLENGSAFVVPFVNEDGEPMWTHEQEVAIIKALIPIFASRSIRKLVQYEQHDRFWLEQYGFEDGGNWHDLRVMHALAYPALPHTLGFICSVHTERIEWKSMVPDWSHDIEEEADK